LDQTENHHRAQDADPREIRISDQEQKEDRISRSEALRPYSSGGFSRGRQAADGLEGVRVGG